MNEKYMEVLERYDLTADSVRRGRSGWICQTGQGMVLLKEYRGTQKRLEFETQVLEQVGQTGGIRVDDYLRTADGQLWAAGEDGTRYVLKHWFADRECSLRDRSEALSAVRRIAVLHKALQAIPEDPEWNLGSIRTEPLWREMERHSLEIKRARGYIRGKKRRNEFEFCIMNNYQRFYEQAVQACEGMKRLNRPEAHAPLFLCHGNLDHHHILMGTGYTAFIEFHKMHLGEPMADLYHFMRKVLEKHSWDLELGLAMLEAYDRVLPLGNRDRDCLYCLFLYPEKYWKQINFYFNGKKNWISARNIEKIHGLELQEAGRNRFLSKIK